MDTVANSSPKPRSSVRERMAAGKALRGAVPRSSLAKFKTFTRRTDPISVLEAQAKSRLPALVPIRHGRMLASPFAFLRGSAAVMAADLATAPVTGLHVQACGDMHVANFGASPRPSAISSLASMTSTKPCPVHGNGI